MERAEYEVMARVEGRHWWYTGMRELAATFLDTVLEGNKNLSVLDAGCGTGGNGLFLQRYGTVTGIDLASAATQVAAQRLPGAIARGSVLHLPFAGESFDLVTSFDVLYHRAVPDEIAALSEVRRVLRPNGLLLMRLPAYQFLLRKHDRAVHTRRRYTAGEVRVLLAGAGLRLLRLSYINSLLLPIPVAQWIAEHLLPAAVERDGSDLSLPRPMTNALLRLPLSLEAAWLRQGGGFPAGLSILCLARKEEP